MTIPEQSRNSLVTAMNQFIRSVDEMDSTVLVPTRLMDIPAVQLDTQGSNNINDERKIIQDNVDLFKFYTMLMEARDEVVWGCRSTEESSHSSLIANQLKQFSRVLNELTDMAVKLKERYEHDINVGTNSPC